MLSIEAPHTYTVRVYAYRELLECSALLKHAPNHEPICIASMQSQKNKQRRSGVCSNLNGAKLRKNSTRHSTKQLDAKCKSRHAVKSAFAYSGRSQSESAWWLCISIPYCYEYGSFQVRPGRDRLSAMEEELSKTIMSFP